MFGFGKKKPEPAPAIRRPQRPSEKSTNPRASTPSDGARSTENSAQNQTGEQGDFQTKSFAGLRFYANEIENQQELSKVVFNEVINDQIKLGPHFYSRVAVARLSAVPGKSCVLFIDRSKVTPDDIRVVTDLLRNQGYEYPQNGPQGYCVASSLVISLSQKTLVASSLAVERDIARDPIKKALMSSFADIVSWGCAQDADDIDFAVDITAAKSQIAFKINGLYIRPEKFLLPTDVMIQMLAIAWQKSSGGSGSLFSLNREQESHLSMDLIKNADAPMGDSVRLRWSGLSTDKGTVVTMRLQRLGAYSRIKSLNQIGYPDSQMEILLRAINSEGGMCVFSGVTGSGKTTSIVQLMNLLRRDMKIVSMEDPVELEILNAYQKTITEILMTPGRHDAMDDVTRALYRSAMDALFLGEVRDVETGLIARQVTESGHSVFTTTHAKGGLGIIDRFASPAVGIPREVLATPEFLKLLVYQALLPTTCPHCGKSPDHYASELNLSGSRLDKHKEYFDRLYRLYGVEPESFRLRDPHGCEKCRRSEVPEINGFGGRTVVSEIIEPDEQMLEFMLVGNNIELNRYWRSLASRDFTDPNLIGKTAMECAVYKAAKGLIDPRQIEPRFMSFETVEAKKAISARVVVSRNSPARR